MKRAASGSAGAAAPLWSRPGFLARRLHQITVAIFFEEMADLDVTPVQFDALTIAADRPGIEQYALGEELGTDRANTGDVVRRLVRNGLAKRKVSQRDHRYREVYVTPAGEAILKTGVRRMRRVSERLLDPLAPDQRTVFLDLLMMLIEGNNEHGRTLLRLPETRS